MVATMGPKHIQGVHKRMVRFQSESLLIPHHSFVYVLYLIIIVHSLVQWVNHRYYSTCILKIDSLIDIFAQHTMESRIVINRRLGIDKIWWNAKEITSDWNYDAKCMFTSLFRNSNFLKCLIFMQSTYKDIQRKKIWLYRVFHLKTGPFARRNKESCPFLSGTFCISYITCVTPIIAPNFFFSFYTLCVARSELWCGNIEKHSCWCGGGGGGRSNSCVMKY
jgi:hypothetical protein